MYKPPPKKAPVLVYDNLDDRREVVTLLRQLPPAARLAWLHGCCAACPPERCRDARPHVKRATCALTGRARWDSAADDRLTLECYTDLWYLVCQYGLDPDAALRRLESLARRAGPG